MLNGATRGSDAAPLILQQGTSRCEIYPALGGSIGRWSVDGQDMIRTASPEAIAAHDPFGMSTFPLVPYSNRIGGAQFEWAGTTYRLQPNFAPEPHAIHGVGWKREWRIADVSNAAVTLKLTHEADKDWPWAFEAEQQIAIAANTLCLTLRATNHAGFAVPLAFGHHPYFDQAGAALSFSARTVWMSGQDALPTEPLAPGGQFDFNSGGAVEGRDIDHCYGGVTGPALIKWRDRRLQLEVSSAPPLPAAVVYVPKGGDAFCFEPVPHVNNALNMVGKMPPMPVVAPGQTSETVLTFKASPK